MSLLPFYSWEDWGLKRRNNLKWPNWDSNPSDFQAHALIRLFNDLGKGTSLLVQWLGHCDSIAGGMGLISGWAIKILHATQVVWPKIRKGMERISVVFCLFLLVNSLQGAPFVRNSGYPSLMIHRLFFFSNWKIIALNLHWFLQHTLTSCCYLYLLSLLSFSSVLPHPVPPLSVITEHQAGLPVFHSSFLLIIYFTHGSVNMSLLLTISLLLPVPSSWRGFSLPTSMRVCLPHFFNPLQPRLLHRAFAYSPVMTESFLFFFFL